MSFIPWLPLSLVRAVDPQSFFADPDPAVFFNADDLDPDPGGKRNADPCGFRSSLKIFVKNKLMKSFH